MPFIYSLLYPYHLAKIQVQLLPCVLCQKCTLKGKFESRLPVKERKDKRKISDSRIRLSDNFDPNKSVPVIISIAVKNPFIARML